MLQSMVMTCMTYNCLLSINVESVTSDPIEMKNSEMADTFYCLVCSELKESETNKLLPEWLTRCMHYLISMHYSMNYLKSVRI